MRINLCEIIEMPGKSLPFQCELDGERLLCPSIEAFTKLPSASGVITNTAGALTLKGVISAEMTCICDRCFERYSSVLELPVELKLAADLEDDDDPDIFALDGDWLDLSDVLETSFILNTDTKFLCKEDCKGLCSRCGKNLNDGPCGCKKEIDPRLAVLGQLLDKTEE